MTLEMGRCSGLEWVGLYLVWTGMTKGLLQKQVEVESWDWTKLEGVELMPCVGGA